VDAGRRAGLQAAEGEAAALLALSCAFRGDLKRASGLARPLVPELGTLREHRPEQAPALVALARCSLDWDDAEEARALAEQARTIAESLGDRLGRVAARIVSAQAIARLSPNSDLAHAELAALAAEGDGPLVPPLLAASVDVLRVRLAEAVGDRAAAAAILIEGTGPEYDVEAARIALSLGELDDACELLGRVLDDGSAPSTTLVDAAVLEALAALRRDASAEAGAWIERAFETAEPDGIRRPFVDGGPQMIRLLRDAIRHGTAHRWLAGSLLAVLEGRQAAGGHMTRELLDPLSDREAIVLGYLPTMLSNQEIAGELFVSVNTVKTHLKSIYRKLGVSSRREAVCLARELRLVG
jgi:LuxR family maltose regulon positive regulatory protein